jgi:hypothetical protein
MTLQSKRTHYLSIHFRSQSRVLCPIHSNDQSETEIDSGSEEGRSKCKTNGHYKETILIPLVVVRNYSAGVAYDFSCEAKENCGRKPIPLFCV